MKYLSEDAMKNISVKWDSKILKEKERNEKKTLNIRNKTSIKNLWNYQKYGHRFPTMQNTFLGVSSTHEY